MLRKSQTVGLRYIAYGVLLGLLAFVLWREQDTFVDSLRLIGTTNPVWTIGGLAIFLISVLAASLVYGLLAPKKLVYWRTLQVQLASLFVNKLLPAGSGALGINYLYLRANKLPKTVAGAIVAGNNLLGFTGHVLLLILACFIFSESLPSSGVFSARRLLVIGTIVCWAVAIVLLAYQAHRWKTPKFIRPLRPLYTRPKNLTLALLCSCVVTACYATALWVAATAFGLHLSPAVTMVVLSFGVAAASAIPVPGGIGAAEAGIFAGLSSYGLPSSNALSVAILFRVITFWLPLIVGIAGFWLTTRHRLLSVKR
jgi:uncharacterized membrane protein YbhN (UPF0104 family)